MATELTCKLSKWSEYRIEYRASNRCFINIRPVVKSVDAIPYEYAMQQNGIDDRVPLLACGDVTIYFKQRVFLGGYIHLVPYKKIVR